MRDPESGRINAGIYRHHVYDERRMGVWFFGSHDGGTIHRRYAEKGEDTPKNGNTLECDGVVIVDPPPGTCIECHGWWLCIF